MPVPLPSDPDSWYTTPDEVRLQLGDSGAVLDQTLLEKAVASVSRAIDKVCDQRFWLDSAVTVKTYRPESAWAVRVDPIGSTSGLLVKTDTGDDGTYETTWTIATDFQLEPLNADIDGIPYAWTRIVSVGNNAFPTGGWRPSLQVTALHGWSSVPDEVNEAAILKAVKLFKRRDSPLGIQGFQDFGPIRISRSEDPDVLALLSPFTTPLMVG